MTLLAPNFAMKDVYLYMKNFGTNFPTIAHKIKIYSKNAELKVLKPGVEQKLFSKK
jgi:hypothetical protein